jgi:hypothetical protein
MWSVIEQIEDEFIDHEDIHGLVRFHAGLHRPDTDLTRLTPFDLLAGVMQALGGYDQHWHPATEQHPPLGAEVTVHDAYAALDLVTSAEVWLERAELVLTEHLRDAGETWTDINNGEGGNAAQQRYRRIGGTRTWPTRRPRPGRTYGGRVLPYVQPDGRPWGVTETGQVRHWLERDRWFPFVSNNPTEGHRAFALCSRAVEPLDLVAAAKAGRTDVAEMAELPLCAACHRLDTDFAAPGTRQST